MIPIDSHLLGKVCSTCFKLCDSSPKLVKDFNICRHNVYEHIPMYGTWFINVTCIIFGVRYFLNTDLNVISSISSILLYISVVDQGFPLGGCGSHRGDVDSRGSYILQILYVEMKESEPLGGMHCHIWVVTFIKTAF